MDVPHVPRVTVPGGIPRNGSKPCQGCMDPPLSIGEHFGDLRDGLATANRASMALRAEVEALRHAVIFALILAGAYFILRGRS